jgi:broad specificity phosphatase PhoE
MSTLYLVRHGQAGTRDNYDVLSETGRLQSRLLGEFLASDNVRIDFFYCGQLNRQRETALEIAAAYRRAGIEIPEPVADPQWNEFDLDGVYQGIAPQMARDDAAFRQHYEELQREAALANSAVHRRWTHSDIAVVRAWIEGRYRYDGESWNDFTARVRNARHNLQQHDPNATIAVSTSATPIGIWTGMALELHPRYIMRTAGVLHNSSYTSFRLRDGEISLFSLNNIPHLREPALRTFR